MAVVSASESVASIHKDETISSKTTTSVLKLLRGSFAQTFNFTITVLFLPLKSA